MAVPIDKEMRERAKRDDKYLFQISLDSKYLSGETQAKFKGRHRRNLTLRSPARSGQSKRLSFGN